MNNIPRGTRRFQLLNSLRSPTHEHATDPAPNFLHLHPPATVTITNSRLDDELSVASIHFSDTPNWLQRTNNDPFGFPKKLALGTLWRPIDTGLDERGQTEFIRAVIKGGPSLLHAEMMAEFEDTDVNTQDAHGQTALHWACAEGHLDMVRLCLSVPESEIGLKDDEGCTAFDIALRIGNEIVAAAFYLNILDMEETHPQEALLRVLTLTAEPATGTALFPGAAVFWAVEEGNEMLVEALIVRGIDLTARNEHGDTALHVAATYGGNIEIVTMLLVAGSDVNAAGCGGATPLHYAVRTGEVSVVRLLLRWKANANARDTEGKVPLEMAKAAAKGYLGAEFNDCAVGVEEIIDQLAAGEHRKRERTVTYRSDPTDQEGLTPLHRAVLVGELDTVQRLLEYGAQIEAIDKSHRTAIHMAVENGHAAIVTILLAAGANIEAATMNTSSQQPYILGQTDSVMTALQLAARCGHTEIVKILLAAGAGICAANTMGHTALHLAAASGYSETVNALLCGGAEVDVWGLYDGTPLYLAAQNGHIDTVNILLVGGANIRAEGHDGTPLQVAAKNGHREVVKVLVAGGAQGRVANARYSILSLLGMGDRSI